MQINTKVVKRFGGSRVYEVVSEPVIRQILFLKLTYYECMFNNCLYLIWDKKIRKIRD